MTCVLSVTCPYSNGMIIKRRKTSFFFLFIYFLGIGQCDEKDTIRLRKGRNIMPSKNSCIKALCNSLGAEYCVREIDLEPVVYRDFGNGFNVEISGVYTTSTKKKATIYLWHGDRPPACIIVKTVRDVERENIHKAVEELLKYSNSLLAQGLDTRDKLFKHKFKIWNIAGGFGMQHKIYYGTKPTFSSKDVSCFSRGKYECKALMRNKGGQPVVISQCKDKDFPVWKVEYGYSCLIFLSFDDAMDFCSGRFEKVD